MTLIFRHYSASNAFSKPIRKRNRSSCLLNCFCILNFALLFALLCAPPPSLSHSLSDLSFQRARFDIFVCCDSKASFIPTMASKSKKFGSGLVKCTACTKTVYPLEMLKIEDGVYHKRCFRCAHCQRVCGLGSFAMYQ